MATTVDIGEATIAVLGIVDVLGGKADKSAAARREVENFPRKIDELAREFVYGEKIKDKLTSFDQKKIARVFTANPEPAIMSLISVPWVDPVPAIGQTLRLRNMVGQLRPSSQLKTLFAVKDLPVASFTWHDFEHALRLINDPLSLFGCMSSGRIGRKLVSVFAQAYPSLLNAVAGSTCVRAVTAVAAGHEIPSRVEDSLSILLSVPGMAERVAAALGTPKQKGGGGGKPTPQAKHGAGLSLAPKSAAIDGQD